MQTVDAGQCQHLHIGTLILGALAGAGLALAAVSAAAYIVLYLWPGYMEKEYQKYDVLSSLPEMTMSDEDGLMAVTEHMMDYLLTGDEMEDLQIEVVMGGETRGFFSERELLHMWDVRRIFRGFIYGSAAALVLALAALFVGRRHSGSLGAGIVAGTAAAVVIAGALLALGGDSFSELFVNFHLMMFDNDLWLLDPAEDMLINIVPEGFFFDTFVRIAAIWCALEAAIGAMGAAFIIEARKH